jgi:GNAT superfamily N-acetyltransferase
MAAQAALLCYFHDIASLAAVSIDVETALEEVDDYRPPMGAFWVVGKDPAIGCAGLRTLAPGVGEIKRMWVAQNARGSGIASDLLNAVETHARGLGIRKILLDTNGGLKAAMQFYVKAGYSPVDRYNDNPDATHFFAKVWHTSP